MHLAPTHPGILHAYAPRLAAFEHTPASSTSSSSSSSSTLPPSNFVLFLGGLNDDLLTVHYPSHLAQLLKDSNPRFSVVEVRLTSSSFGWTTSNLDRDANEVADAVKYFQNISEQRAQDAQEARISGHIILLGHSTGTQIATTYLIGNRNHKVHSLDDLGRPPVSGVVLQACASDREGAQALMDAARLKQSIDSARKIAADPAQVVAADAPLGPDDHMPRFFTAGLFDEEGPQPQPQPSAKRWLSLVTEGGDDDLFSSDLPDDVVRRVWGSDGGLATRNTPLCVLWGERDEFIPRSVDKETVLSRWKKEVSATDGGKGLWNDENSGVVAGASHNLNKDTKDVVNDLSGRIVRFCISVAKR
ncbi:MAG: hypothetical protein M1831_004684 [Alyxoria varia]|nr:MAG: hypothetical protein M1831_004684 [Alyxoria varia]